MTTCRLNIAKPNYLDALLRAAWDAAEEVFVDPSNAEARAALAAANAAVDAARKAPAFAE